MFFGRQPGGRATDRGDKFYEYEPGGVPEYWLRPDPQWQQAELYLRGYDSMRRIEPPAGNSVCLSKVLAGLWLKVDWLGQPLPPPVMEVLGPAGGSVDLGGATRRLVGLVGWLLRFLVRGRWFVGQPKKAAMTQHITQLTVRHFKVRRRRLFFCCVL